MTSVAPESDRRLAGAQRAPAAFLVGAIVVATLGVATARGSGTPTTGELTLVQLVAESALVVDGVVTRTESLDEDRLRVHHFRPDQALKGTTAADDLPIVDMRGATSRPALLADGTRAIVLLRPAPPLSYLSQRLPAGTQWVLAGGRDGIIALADDAERRTVEPIVAEAMRIATLTDEAQIRAARRAQAFAALATRHPRLAADALTQLRRLPDVASLTPDELGALERTLATRAVLPATRTGLIRLVGERGWKEALPALRRVEPDSPQILDAILDARAKLGAPADADELEAYLDAKDPAVRAAAIRGLAALDEPAVGEIGRFATSDADTGVRVAAIDALGAAKKPAAIPTLSRTFAEPTREVRQASGRALIAIGGPAASDAFVNLALHGPDADTRKYAALLLVTSTGRDSPPVRRLIAANPSSEVQHVLEHGLEFRHTHRHGAE